MSSQERIETVDQIDERELREELERGHKTTHFPGSFPSAVDDPRILAADARA